MNLKNAVALVTGGGSGLGEATVREFAAAGAKVAILDLPSSPGAKLAESIGANALFVEADVASADQVTDAIAKTDLDALFGAEGMDRIERDIAYMTKITVFQKRPARKKSKRK